MRAFLQPISARIYFGKTASHRKRARFVQSRGASPQAYWMSVKAAQRRGCAKRAFCGVCFLMPGGLRPGVGACRKVLSFRASDRVTGVGIRLFGLGRTDCHVAALLAMTDFVGADDSARPVKAPHPVGRDPCVPPPRQHVSAAIRRGGRLCPPHYTPLAISQGGAIVMRRKYPVSQCPPPPARSCRSASS